MKKLLTQYSAYNLWANQQFLDLIAKLPEELHTQEIISSFPGLVATLLHIRDAESIWWQRIKLAEIIERPSEKFCGSLAEVSKGILNQSRHWHDWILQSPDHMFDHELIYYTSKKERFKQSIGEILLHVFNHSTYHRGHLVTILRQLGISNIPVTDFAYWARKK